MGTHYSTLLGTIAAIESDMPVFAELEPLGQAQQENMISSLSGWSAYGDDSKVFDSATTLKKRHHQILTQLWESTEPDTLVHDLLWFELFYLDVRSNIRKHVTSQTTWSSLQDILTQARPEWSYVETQLEEIFELLTQNEKSHLTQELALDHLKMSMLTRHYHKSSSVVKGYLELRIDNYNTLLSARMSLAGRETKLWQPFLIHLDEELSLDGYTLLSPDSSHTIDLMLLGQSNPADTSPSVIEQYYSQQLVVYVNQAIFESSLELQVIRLIHRLEACFELTKLLLFAPTRPDRLSAYNYDRILV